MSRKVLLNNVDHPDLRVAMRHGPEFGDAVNQMLVFPTEFEEAQRDYPILFRRDEDGDLQAVVLLGLDRDENLFLDDQGRWDARYVPALAARGPFSIVLQRADAASEPEPMIHVDLDDPRVGWEAGEPLFLAHGGNAPALQRAVDRLGAIYEGMEQAGHLYAALDAAGLFEPVKVEILLSDTERYDLDDYHSVAAERLASLDGDMLAALNRAGYLRTAFLALASLGNVDRLIQLKLLRRAAG